MFKRSWFISIVIFSLLFLFFMTDARAAETTTVETTLGVVNNVVDKVSEGMQQLTQAMSSAAPKAWELVVKGNWAAAAVSITGAALFGVVFVLCALNTFLQSFYYYKSGVTVRTYKTHDNKIEITKTWDDRNCKEGLLIFAIFSGVAALTAFIVGIFIAMNNAAMFFAPEAMTARDFLFRFIGH